MRINVDGYALRDPRNLRLARRLGVPRHHVLGQLLDVWAVCYDRVSAVISVLDIDTAAERDGFAVAMCDPEIDLAELLRNGRVKIRGAEKRIRYLGNQRERGRKGGKKSAETRASKRTLNESPSSAGSEGFAEPQAAAKPSGSGSGSFSGSSSGSGSTLGSEGEERPLALLARPPIRKGKPKPSDLTPGEVESATTVLGKITARTQVKYSAETHQRLVIARLRDGITERELRGVIAYCWSDTGLNWQSKALASGEPMARYLRPETLFGPKKIHQYLPPARAWLAKYFPD